MTITLELPAELEQELAIEANQLGLSRTEYALRVLSIGLVMGDKPKTGAALVAYWQTEALVGSRPDRADSQTHARRIRAAAERGIRT